MNRINAARSGITLRHFVSRFARKQDGTVTLFGMLMFILMIAIGGIAIDVMRYETQRVQLQYTLDRAILAAAALNQTQTPEAVVEDYFARSGLEHYRLRLEVDDGVNFRTVSASVEMDVDTVFMDMFGIRALTSPAYGRAEERVRNVEISLVLDVSGSMGWDGADGGTKLENLQAAANSFIATVMEANESATDGMLVSVSIVPYAGFVNAGSTINSVYNIDNRHSYSNCTRFSEDQFGYTGLGDTEVIARLSHYDRENQNSRNAFHTESYCPTDDTNAILPWSSSITELQTMINNFEADGWTAIDQGMRWGVTLLDPSSQDELVDLFDEGAGPVHADFVGRPVAYDNTETLKIVLLMTDGENTQQWDIREEFRTGPSTVWYNEDDDRWSMYVPQTDEYWIPDQESGDSTTYNNRHGDVEDEPYPNSEPVSWEWLWANFTERSIAHQFYRRASQNTGNWDHHDDIRSGIQIFSGPSEARGDRNIYSNANLLEICDEANDAGIIVFTVAFEAPNSGQQILEDCAYSPAHYYEVEGFEINDAFDSIASTINTLRLTQ